MGRFLYVCLLRMHPVAFRESFAAEMLWIFDETAQGEGPSALLVDGLFSLFRQWILRSGLWRILTGFAGASLQFFAISLCFHLKSIVTCSAHAASSEAHERKGTGLLAMILVVAVAALLAAAAFRARSRMVSTSDQDA